MRYRWIVVLVLAVSLVLPFLPAPQAARASTITTVDSTPDVGWYTSIAILNGLPVISYYERSPVGNLKVARCGTADCSSGNTLTTIDSAGDVGKYTSIAILNGLPVISYFDGNPN